MHYQYDGSFLGFLCVIYEAYHDGTSHVEGIENRYAGASLFNCEKTVAPDIAKAGRVIDSLRGKCGAAAAQTLYYAFMGEQPEREMLLFYYICHAFRSPGGLPQDARDPWISQVEKWALKTSNERHRMLGLLRFSELDDGMLYSAIRPDYNIAPLMAGHFASRMPGEEWAIHDLRRHTAVYYDKERIITADVAEPESNIKLSRTEEEFRRIWRRYYRHISIEERSNPDLRRSFMPEKYWPYLTEMTAR